MPRKLLPLLAALTFAACRGCGERADGPSIRPASDPGPEREGAASRPVDEAWTTIARAPSAHCARPGQARWARRFGGLRGPGKADLGSIVAEPSGAWTVAGHMGDDGESMGGGAAFFAALDRTGEVIWERRLGGEGSYAPHLARVPSGGVLATVPYSGTVRVGDSIFRGEGRTNDWHSLFLSLDDHGAVRWVRHVGDQGSRVGVDSITTDGEGNLVMAGSFTTSIALGRTILTTGNPRGAHFIAKVTAAGEEIWSRKLDEENEPRLLHAAVHADGMGKVVLAGDRGQRLSIMRLTADGAVVPGTLFPGKSSCIPKIARDAAGNLLIAGSLHGTLIPGDGLAPLDVSGDTLPDAFILSLAPDGHPRWARRFGDDASQVVNAIAARGDRFAIAGGFGGKMDFGGATLAAPGDFSGFVATFDGAGNLRWSRVVGDDAVCNAIAVDDAGNLVVGGDFRGRLDLGDGVTLEARTSRDAFVAALCP